MELTSVLRYPTCSIEIHLSACSRLHVASQSYCETLRRDRQRATTANRGGHEEHAVACLSPLSSLMRCFAPTMSRSTRESHHAREDR